MAAVEVPQTLKYKVGQLNDAPILEVENFTNWKKRNINHVKDYELASLFGKLKYEENLIDSIYETEKSKSLISATPLSTAFLTTSIVQDFQVSPDDEEDTRSNHEYLNDLEEEYQARALLAKSKRFFKKGTQRFSSAKATDQTECHKCGKKGHFGRDGDLDNSTSNALIPLDSWTSGLLVYKLPSSGTESRLRPYHFNYLERSLTMEEMLNKFIDEGKREHEDMSAFIYDFQTNNELLFKERNNLLIELRFGVQEFLKVINNVPMMNCDVKGVTTRVGSKEVLTNDQPQTTSEPVVQPSNEVQTPPVPFPRRLRKEKEEAQQKKFLENLKQLHINLPFIKALAQMPKYAKFLKGLLSNKARLEEACKIIMNERCSVVLLNKLPSKEKDLGSFTIPYDIGKIHIDLECCESASSYGNNESDPENSIRRNDSANTPYLVTQGTTKRDDVKSKHLYSASANEIDEKKPELKNLPQHLEYAYLHGDKSFPIIISSKLQFIVTGWRDSSKYQSLWRIKKRLPSPVLMGLSLIDECRLDYVMLLPLSKDA
ncbi:hypothetical protein Tco_0341520 [Tanacetum coccineum]